MSEFTEDHRDALAEVAMKLHRIQKVAESLPDYFITEMGMDRMRQVRQRLNRLRLQDNKNAASSLEVFLDWWSDQDETIFAIIHNPTKESAALRHWLSKKGFPEYMRGPIAPNELPPKARLAHRKFYDFREAVTLLHEDWWALVEDAREVFRDVRSKR